MAKRILIAESNDYLSETLGGLLTAFGFDVVGATADRTRIHALVQALEPDLLLVDYDLSQQMDIEKMRAQFPRLKIVASCLHETIDGFAGIARRLGLDGFFSKYAPQKHLHQSLDTLFT